MDRHRLHPDLRWLPPARRPHRRLSGRRCIYLVGAVGFAVAPAPGGLATDEELLSAARGLQGAFGALPAPASLALLTVLCTDTPERAKDFAVHGAVAGGGSAVGLLLGGMLTEYADWRWCFWVDEPVAVVAVAAAIPVVPESRAPGGTRYDVPGAVLVTLGLASSVHGFTCRVPPRACESRVQCGVLQSWTAASCPR